MCFLVFQPDQVVTPYILGRREYVLGTQDLYQDEHDLQRQSTALLPRKISMDRLMIYTGCLLGHSLEMVVLMPASENQLCFQK